MQPPVGFQLHPLCHSHGIAANACVLMQVYDPKGKMRLDVSMFERLVTQGRLPVHTMLVQRRMRPCIADLIRNTLYPELQDGPNVKQYPHVTGDDGLHSHYFVSSSWVVSALFLQASCIAG